MSVPAAVASTGMTNLNEANTIFRKTPRQKKLAAEIVGLLRTDAVHLFHMLGLGGEVNDLRSLQHHAGGQFEGPRTSRDLAFDFVIRAELLVEFRKRLHLAISLFAIGTGGWQQIR